MHRQRDHARAQGADHRHPHARLAARRRRLPLVLHRQVAPLPLPHPRHGGLRLRRLGRQRPPLHGLGRHRRPLRPDHRLQRRPLAHRARRIARGLRPTPRRALVPHRGPGQPARRDVVPDRPARLPARATPTTWPRIRQVLESAAWKDDDALPVFTDPYAEVVDELPANFDDDLHAKPEAHRQWRWDQQHGLWGYIDPADKGAWLRHLDYYVKLQQLADRNLGTVLSALEATGAWDDTIIIFTSDHGDMCGSHGLRSKGPFVYDEIMRVPLYMRVPGMTTPGSTTSALGTHVDLAATICALGRRGPDGVRSHGAGCRPDAGAGRPLGVGARPRPVRPGLGADHRAQQGALRPPRLLRRAPPSTPGTTGSAGASPPPGCGESRRAPSCSTSTAPSTTRTTSGTTTTRIPTSWSTWPTTGPGARSSTASTNGCGPTSGSRSTPSARRPATGSRAPEPFHGRPLLRSPARTADTPPRVRSRRI